MADTKRYASVPVLTLADDLSSSGAYIKTTTANDWGGNVLTTADFNTDYIPATIINDAKTLVEFILIDATTIGNLTTTGALIYKRGLKYYAEGDSTDSDEVTANKLAWTQGESKLLIGTNPPWMYGKFPSKENDETITQTWTFTDPNLPRVNTYNAPTDPEQFATKAYVDAAATGGATTGKLIVSGIAGEVVAAGNFVYLDTTDNEWKLTDANSASTSQNVFLGIAQGAGTNGNVISGGVLILGRDDNQTGMSQGDIMYLSDTAGAISSTPGTINIPVGIAVDSNSIDIQFNYSRLLSKDQQDALAGTSGTPSSSNKFVTNDDTSATPAAGEVVRYDGSGLIAEGAIDYILDGLSKTYPYYDAVTAGDSLTLINDGGTYKVRSMIGIFNQVNTHGASGSIRALCKIDSNKIFLATGNAGNLQGTVGTIAASGAITFGTPVSLNKGTVTGVVSLAVCQIGTNRVALAVGGTTAGNPVCQVSLIDITGTVPSNPAPTIVYGGAVNATEQIVTISSIGTDLVVVGHSVTAAGYTIYIGDVSGSSYSNIDSVSASSVDTTNAQLIYVAENKALFVNSENGANYQRIMMLSYDGAGNLTAGSNTRMLAVDYDTEVSAVLLSSTSGVITAHNGTDRAFVYFSISGTTVTPGDTLILTGAEYTAEIIGPSYMVYSFGYIICFLDDSYVTLTLQSGNVLEVLTNNLFPSRAAIPAAAAQVSKSTSVVEYAPGLFCALDSTTLVTGAFDYDKYIGFAQTTGVADDENEISLVYQFNTNQSSLVAMSRVYIDYGGNVTTVPTGTLLSSTFTNYEIGKALNSTSIQLTDFID